MPYHLLFPLLSGVLFVLGMMLVKQAISRGASPWTGVLIGNIWIASIWGTVAVVRQQVVSTEAWGYAAVIGLGYVLGQVFTYLAFQRGDVTVATPILGVKVLIVATMLSLFAGENLPARIWIAAGLATVGIAFVQRTDSTPGETAGKNRTLTIVLALIAAFALSTFDVLLQQWGTGRESAAFLPVVFAFAAVFSLAMLPWVDKPGKLRETGSLKWLLGGTLLMALQAISISFALSKFEDATRINIVYSLRGMWGVVLVWMLGKYVASNEANLSGIVMGFRIFGALLLTVAVVIAIAP